MRKKLDLVKGIKEMGEAGIWDIMDRDQSHVHAALESHGHEDGDR